MNLVVVTQWVRAKAQVPPDQRLASRSVVPSTCKPRNGRTELEGTRRQAACWSPEKRRGVDSRIALRRYGGESRRFPRAGRQPSGTRHGERPGHHRGLSAGHVSRGVARELGRATCLLATVAGLGSRLTQRPWRGPGGLPPSHEPETETTNDGSPQGLGPRATSEATRDGQGGSLRGA